MEYKAKGRIFLKIDVFRLKSLKIDWNRNGTAQSKLHCMDPIIAENLQILQQGIFLLESITNERYKQKQEILTSSIGEHFRHIIEHYELFWNGLNVGHIDYDKRNRNPRLETDRLFAIESMEQYVSLFQTQNLKPEKISISQNYNPNENVPIIPSYTNRELQFLLSHTVHHYAIISILVKLDGGVVSKEFGFSPATLFAKT